MTTARHTAARTATLAAPPLVMHTAARRAVVTAADEAARTLEVCVVPWHETARVSDDGGRTFYDESWAPGSLEPADLVPVFDGHRSTPAGVERGEVIGRADNLTDDGTGMRAIIRLADSVRGRDVHAVARTLGQVWVSLEADVPPTPPGAEAVARTASAPCRLTGVSVVLPPAAPAYTGAVGAARAASPDPDPTPDPDPADPDNPDETVTLARVRDMVRTEAVRVYGTAGARSSSAPHPLARFESFDDLHAAVRSSSSTEAHTLSHAFSDAYTTYRTAVRAWVNQITPDNPGVMPPGWLTDVFGIVDRGRPAITALGGPRSPGASGLDVHWPYYDGDLTTIVGEQVAQKTDIVSVLVSFKRGQATLKTYAGGSDVAYQLQRRSSPSYMALYDRILQIAYGITTENAFIDALVAGATGSLVLEGGPVGATADAIKTFLFGASSRVRTATGAPASVALVSTDVFEAWGGLDNLVPATYGTQNVPGTSQASTLRISISGLEITEAPMAPAGTVLVTNESAAAWLEEGPFLAAAEDVQKLGTDVAIWGMGAPGLFLPAGVVKATAVTATRASRSSW